MLQSDASEFITRDKRKICFFLLNSKFLTDISKSNQIWNRPRVQFFKIFMNFHFQRFDLTHVSQLKDITVILSFGKMDELVCKLLMIVPLEWPRPLIIEIVGINQLRISESFLIFYLR